jgi:arylformamidase
MLAKISVNQREYTVDLSRPCDLSMPLKSGKKNVNAFYIPDVRIEPFGIGNFVGAVSRGGACNVNNIFFSPHGNGTHTECVGHISKEFISLNHCMKEFFFVAKLITIAPEKKKDDMVITLQQVKKAVAAKPSLPDLKALVIRTLPNAKSKLTMNYSGTNPPYLDVAAAQWMHDQGIEHLLLDLPSVDREMDGGKLTGHHAYWNYPAQPRMHATITELIYVHDKIKDGNYLLNLMIASFENDASPSKPVLYALK